MKVNLEFNAGELEDFLLKFLSKGLFRLVSSQDPAVSAALGAIQQGLLAIAMTGARPQGFVGRGQGPYPSGGFGPGAGPFGPFGPGPGQAQGPGTNVRPIREPGAIEHCIPIEESKLMEAGWACCSCGSFNGVQRTACRQCGHPCCTPGAAPQPSPMSPPEQQS